MTSLFISFEGIEGCGKSTQIQLLHEALLKQGKKVLLTREPGGTLLGEQIRKILLARENTQMTSLCELFLYAADRAQHCEEVILPALKKNFIVLCDRFSDSTLAYQVGGRQIPLDKLQPVLNLANTKIKPHLTFLLDCPVETGLNRAKNRGQIKKDQEDRFEQLELDFHKRVREYYLKISREEKDRIVVMDGTREIKEIQKEIFKKLESYLQK